MHPITPSPNSTMPRSRRVAIASPPPGFNLSTSPHHPSPPPSPTASAHPASPPIPLRSPLRPRARTLAPVHKPTPPTPPPQPDDPAIAVHMPLAFPRNPSFGSLNGLLDAFAAPADKALPRPPDSPLPLSPVDDGSASSTSSLLAAAPLSKRTHALLELLSSERAYASDLALIRDIHIPLALGTHPPVYLHSTPLTPPQASPRRSTPRPRRPRTPPAPPRAPSPPPPTPPPPPRPPARP